MELKFFSALSIGTPVAGSNRTFMELKFNEFKEQLEAAGVLIAPLWN